MSAEHRWGALESLGHATFGTAVMSFAASNWFLHLGSSLLIALLTATAVHFFKKYVLERKDKPQHTI